jgi:SAM-dependent methyltransferase
MSDAVLWHDIECGGYSADLPLWRELAAGAGGPMLDVGAGTGRVALDLAAAGHEVVALDAEAGLLAALADRAERRGLDVETVAADAREFDLGRRFALVLVPMQTLQLLGGAAGRARFLGCARAHVAPGGLVAAAIAELPPGLDVDDFTGTPPDMREVDGVVYASRPVAMRDEGGRFSICRVRETVDAVGTRTEEDDVICLDRVDAATVAREGAAAGLSPLEPHWIDETDEHVGSTVVMLGG